MATYNEPTGKSEDIEGAIGPASVSKLKEYGKKAYVPLLNVVYKYQDEFTPYLHALAKGLRSGGKSLNKENSTEAEKYVAHFFDEAADGLTEACNKLETKDFNQLGTYLSDIAEKRPSVMFSTSYIAGVFFGRLSRHIINQQRRTQSLH